MLSCNSDELRGSHSSVFRMIWALYVFTVDQATGPQNSLVLESGINRETDRAIRSNQDYPIPNQDPNHH